MARIKVIVAVLSTLGLLLPMAFAEELPEESRANDLAKAAPHCDSSCRGVGAAEVKVAEEHCGFTSREAKLTALDAACSVAEATEEELKKEAAEEAESRCRRVSRKEECHCEPTIHRWENLYTHVLSSNCWAECGWATVLECGADDQLAS